MKIKILITLLITTFLIACVQEVNEPIESITPTKGQIVIENITPLIAGKEVEFVAKLVDENGNNIAIKEADIVAKWVATTESGESATVVNDENSDTLHPKIIFSSLNNFNVSVEIVNGLHTLGADFTNRSTTKSFEVVEKELIIDLSIKHDTPKIGKVNFNAIINPKSEDLTGATYEWAVSLAGTPIEGIISDRTDIEKVIDFTGKDAGTYTVSLTVKKGTVSKEIRGNIFIQDPSTFDIAMGANHTALGVKNSSGIYFWGKNSNGELCSSDIATVTTPHIFNTVAPIISTASGDKHTLFLLNSGTAYGCGSSEWGQLGFGYTQNATTPVPIKVPFPLIKVSAGGDSSSALTIKYNNGNFGMVYVWGKDDGKPEPTPKNTFNGNVAVGGVQLLSMGKEHLLARVTWALNLFGYGTNTYKQLALPNKYYGTTSYVGGPYASVSDDGGFAGAVPPFYIDNAKLAVAGDYFSMAIRDTTLYVWGLNDQGQLGIGDMSTGEIFNKNIAHCDKYNASAVCSGTSQKFCDASKKACASDISLWNQNISPKPSILFSGNAQETLSAGPQTDVVTKSVIDATAGRAHAFAIADDGTLYGWGDNAKSQVGVDVATKTPQIIAPPVGLNKYIKVWAGGDRSIVLADDNNLYTWGDNNDGILGVGNITDVTIKTPEKLFFYIK